MTERSLRGSCAIAEKHGDAVCRVQLRILAHRGKGISAFVCCAFCDAGLPGERSVETLAPIASPAQVRMTERRKSLLHLLTKLSAVIGGIFAVTGMVDKLVHAITHTLIVSSSPHKR